MLMGMLRERGELALARGDRHAAESAWSEMLKMVVEPTDRNAKKPALKPNRPAANVTPPTATVPGQPKPNAAGP